MKKKNTLVTIFIVSIAIGIYSLSNIFDSSNNFKDSFNEFEPQSELKVELDKGIYDLFELSNKSDYENLSEIDYFITAKGENPKTIEIVPNSENLNSKHISTITYTIYDKRFKSIGQFEINEKQSVKIISKINDSRIDKLAYRSKKKSVSFFGVMKYSFALLVSIIGFLTSGILLLNDRKKQKTIAYNG